MDNQLSSKRFRGLASDFICHQWTTVGGVRVCEIKRRPGCGVCVRVCLGGVGVGKRTEKRRKQRVIQ